MSFLTRGADIHQLPASLEKFIQEQAASGFGKIRLIPLAFPVFILNSPQYPANIIARTSSEVGSGVKSAAPGHTETLFNILGQGEVKHIFMRMWASAGNVDKDEMSPVITIDEGKPFNFTIDTYMNYVGGVTNTPTPITFVTIDDPNDTFAFWILGPLEFQKSFKMEIINSGTGTLASFAIYNKTLNT